jgi:hypothetical protein
MGQGWQATQENRAVDAYLRFLTTGELPTPPSTDAKVEVLDTKIANETRLFVKVQLLQEKRDLTKPTVTEADLVEDFVKHAPGFTERNGIAYVTWREMGVSAAVLKRAGIRIRAYVPRSTWTNDRKAQYVTVCEADGVAAAIEHFNLGCTEDAGKQRYFKFRRELGLPSNGKRGRPRRSSQVGEPA